MPRVGTIDERFQSFNIEMLEVTGGRFWAPYKQQSEASATSPDANGVWTPVEAKKFLAYTHLIGGSIAAAEMFN
ncbi:MAG TPA: hypothetical protein VNX17_10270 [Edaphobacter sp.]|jgi:hypothetical protein|nr:hypothetical protein [Edaphobacter sp.]